MRINIILVLISSAVYLGCNESFEPKELNTNVYAIYCTVNYWQRDSIQYCYNGCDIKAYLTKIYDTTGTKVYPVKDITSIPGATIEIFSNGKYPYRYRLNEIKAEGACKYYQLSLNSLPCKVGDTLILQAKLPNGTILLAKTIQPSPIEYGVSYEYSEGFRVSETIGKYWTFDFKNAPIQYDYSGSLMAVKWGVRYKLKNVSYIEDAPIDVGISNGIKYPIYSSLSYALIKQLNFEALDFAYKNIALKDTAKKNMTLQTVVTSIMEYNEDLSKYYLSTSGNREFYSIRTDKRTYSNIKGGMGIFGISIKHSKEYPFYIPYVRSLGFLASYNYDYDFEK